MTGVYGALITFLLLGFIGLGPALFVFKNRYAIFLAPAIGLLFTTLIGTYLILLNFPVMEWSVAWSIIGILLSVSLIIRHWNIIKDGFFYDKRIYVFFIGLIITSFLILIPIVIGGLNFIVLRGNGTDSFNYITMAGYLLHEPYSFIHTSDVPQLLYKHPSYLLAKELLETRWSTSMLLAWTADISKVPLYYFDYAFSCLFFMISYACAFALLSLSEIKIRYIFLVSIALSVGFLGQFIIDIRALSNVSAMPLCLLFVFLIAYIEEKLTKSISLLVILLGMSIVGIMMLYVEMIPFVFLGTGLFFLYSILFNQYKIMDLIKKYWILFPVVIFFSLPFFRFLFHFLLNQISFGVTGHNQWQKAYFPWLYARPLIGFWGFSYLNYSVVYLLKDFFPPVLIKLPFLFLSICLTIIFLIICFSELRERKKQDIVFKLSMMFFLSGLLLWGCLYFHGQLWSAGKCLSYGLPFVYFILADIFLHREKKQSYSYYFFKWIILIWFFIQCGLSIFRIVMVSDHKEYPRYIAHHGEYRKHDWDINMIVNELNELHVKSLGLYTHNTWLNQYLAFVLGWQFHLIDFDQLIQLNEKSLNQFVFNHPPEYFIVTKNYLLLNNDEVIAHNNEFYLIKVSKKEIHGLFDRFNL